MCWTAIQPKCAEIAANVVGYGAFRYLIQAVPLNELPAVGGRAAGFGRVGCSKRASLKKFGSGRFTSATKSELMQH